MELFASIIETLTRDSFGRAQHIDLKFKYEPLKLGTNSDAIKVQRFLGRPGDIRKIEIFNRLNHPARFSVICTTSGRKIQELHNLTAETAMQIDEVFYAQHGEIDLSSYATERDPRGEMESHFSCFTARGPASLTVYYDRQTDRYDIIADLYGERESHFCLTEAQQEKVERGFYETLYCDHRG